MASHLGILKCCGVFLLLFFCSEADAQVAGYLGHRSVLGVELGVFPNLWQTLQNEQPIRINTQFGLQGERVVTRGLAIGGHVQGFVVGRPYATTSSAGRMQMQGLQIGLDIRAYTFARKGNVPPLGPFHRFGVSFVEYRVKDLDQQYYPDGRENLGHFQAALLSYTIGAQRVIADRFTISAGMRLSWMVAFSPATFPSLDTYIWDASVGRLRGFFGGQFVFGSGILLK